MNDEQTATPKDDRSEFVQHLERASETVRSWPAWKQTMLGGIQLRHGPGASLPENRTRGLASNSEDAQRS